MFYGKFPETDHLGNEWNRKDPRSTKAGTALSPSGFCGVLWAISGDGEFYQNELKLPGHSHSDCCWSCSANKSTIPHNDYRKKAAWRATLKDLATEAPTVHQLADVPGVNGWSFHYDVLHILEEGVAAHCVANCLFDFIVRSEFPEANQELRLKAVYRAIFKFYEEFDTDASNRIRHLHMSSFCAPQNKWDRFPELSGFKARHIRYMVPCILELCRDKLDSSKSYTRHRFLCLENLEGMYSCLEESGLHLAENTSKKFEECTNLCLLHYAKLSKLAIESNILMWNTVHKHHLACHIPAQARYLNPKFVSTYSGETMVGYMSALGHSCLNGTQPHQVPTKVAWRFRLGLHLRTQGNDELMESDWED